MTVKRWQNAINDFRMSLHHGYPEGEYKLHHKIGQCWVKLKKYKSATESFRAALTNLESKQGEVDSKVVGQFSKILKDCIEKFSAKQEEKTVNKSSEVRVSNPHNIDPRLHESVEIMEEVGKGRTAFAKTSIGVGTVIALDNGLGAHLNPDDPSKTLQYCVQCLANVSIPYPCPRCPRVVFCSQHCQHRGLEAGHKYQCQMELYGMRQKDTKDGCSIFSCLTLLTSYPASVWLEHQTRLLLSSSPATDWPTPNTSVEEELSNLCDMVTNTDMVEREANVRHYVTVVLLLRALRTTSWYQDSDISASTSSSGPLCREELVMGRLLYKFRLIKDMNAHPVWGVELNPKDPSQVGTEKVGQGLYTAIASYFNSDCNPNTLRLNIGRQMFLVASKNIRKGEEITDNYCIHFSDMEGAERREWMMVSAVQCHRHNNVLCVLGEFQV